jgi:hypothetical protein
VEQSNTSEAEEADVGTGGSPVGWRVVGTCDPACMGMRTRVVMSIGSTSKEGMASSCCKVDREKSSANGKRVSSKIACR